MIDIQKTSQPPTQDVHGKYPENTLFFVVAAGQLEVYLSSLDGMELSKVFGKTDADLIYAKTDDIDTKRIFTTQQTPSGGTLAIAAGAVAWNCDTNGQVVNLTLNANATLSAPTNVVANTLYMVRVAQDATGSRTLAYNVAYKFGDAGAPVIPVTANKGHWLTFIGRPGNTMEYLGIRTGF